MARVILSEYAAKKLLIGGEYCGCTVDRGEDVSALKLSSGEYVVKVDDGTKKRNKKSLVKLSLSVVEAKKQAKVFLNDGYARVLIEPMSKHEEKGEQYISCTLVRAGVEVLYSEEGGNEIEASSGSVVSELITRADFLDGNLPKFKAIPTLILRLVVSAMREYNLSFVEINPFVQDEDGESVLLDAAVELDSSKLHTLPEWVAGQVQKKLRLPEEVLVSKLDEQSTASFSLTVFNKDASIFTLLSGGGASLVVLDALVDIGLQDEVGNYGEYSGAPTQEETKIYTNALLQLLFTSRAKRKVLVIAGGVANFTDITTTFLGVVDACREHIFDFKEQAIQVMVRRGGPRQAEGLALLRAFFAENGIKAEVSGPEVSLPQIAIGVKTFLDK